MLEHTDEFIDALEFKFPGYQFVFFFDWSLGHAKYPAGAPNIHAMNVNLGEKRGVFCPAHILEDFNYPENFPPTLVQLKKGDVQHMVFQENDPPPFYRPCMRPADYVGKPKGIKQILFERGLFVEGMTSRALSY